MIAKLNLKIKKMENQINELTTFMNISKKHVCDLCKMFQSKNCHQCAYLAAYNEIKSMEEKNEENNNA